jgi:S-adenosyl methyltransferase
MHVHAVMSVGMTQSGPSRPEIAESIKPTESVPARTRDQIAGFFGDFTLAEPGLTDVWAWRPEDDTATMTSDFMRILGGVARKEPA